MQRKDCPACQRLATTLFHPNVDIPSTLERSRRVFNDQECGGEHTVEAFLTRLRVL